MRDIQQAIEDACERLPNWMSERRWRHTLGVAETARELARQHGLDSERAFLAGLLHDCAKEMKEPRLVDLAKQGKVATDGFTLATPGLHHAVVGCHIAAERFDVTEVEVLEAIRYHGTGAPGLGMIAALVYVADWIEPGRSFPGLEELRRLGESDLHGLIDAVAQAKLMHNVARGRAVHPYAVAFYNERVLGARPTDVSARCASRQSNR